MEWQVGGRRRKTERQPSLSEWLHTNRFRAETVNQVFAGTTPQPLLAKLKRIRQEAAGPGGCLSRSQQRSHTALLRPGTAGDTPAVRGATGDSSGQANAVKALERKLADAIRRAETAEKRAPSSVIITEVDVGGTQAGGDSAGSQAAGQQQHPSGKAAWATKTCHLCGGADHLQAKCPLAADVRKAESWLVTLRGDMCDMEPERKEEAIRAGEARLQRLKEQAVAAKAKTVLPEQLMSQRRAALKSASEKLARAKSALETHETKLATLQAETERLRTTVAECSAQESSAQALLAEVLPVDPPTHQATDQQAAPDVREAGEQLMNLAASASQLGTAENLAKAYQRMVDADPDAEHIPLLAFGLREFGATLEMGLRALAGQLRQQDSGGTVGAAVLPPGAQAAVAPRRPTAAAPPGADGDGSRLPTRQPTKHPERASARDMAVAGALAQRSEERTQLRAAGGDDLEPGAPDGPQQGASA